jgi:hypothetical protein
VTWPRGPASYVECYLPDGFTASAAAKAPSLAWNHDDALQDMLVRKVFRRAITRPTHFVPTAEGFAAAVRPGLGWGMFPETLAAPQLAQETFVRRLRRGTRRFVPTLNPAAGGIDGRAGDVGGFRGQQECRHGADHRWTAGPRSIDDSFVGHS